MKKCYNKFFDSSLVIDKELNMYTVGNPYVWLTIDYDWDRIYLNLKIKEKILL